MADTFTIQAVFKALDRFTRPLRMMQRRFNRFGRVVRRGLGRIGPIAQKAFGLARTGAGSLAKGIAVVGAAATAATVAIIGMTKHIIGVFAKFEHALVSASAKFPEGIRKGTEAFKELSAVAQEVGGTTEFTATQSAEALNFLAMAGFNAKQAISALPGVVDLATVAQVDLGRASDVATDSLGAFNLMSKDAAQLSKNLARVNDVMAKTTTTANTDMEQMFEAIKFAGPVATGAGASIETFSALVGELANSGLKGSIAGTVLKNAFTRLAAPPTEAAKALKKLNIETKDSQGNMRDITAIIGDLSGALEDMGTADRAGFLTDIFGLRAVAGANVLLNSGAKKLQEYRTTLEGAKGAAGEMAGVMRDDTEGALKALESAIESVKIAIGELIAGPIGGVITSTTEWIRANKDLIASGVAEFINKFAAKLPGIGEDMLQVARATGNVLLRLMGVNATVDDMSFDSLVNGAKDLVDRVRELTNIFAESFMASVSDANEEMTDFTDTDRLKTLNDMAESLGKIAGWIVKIADVLGGIIDAGGAALFMTTFGVAGSNPLKSPKLNDELTDELKPGADGFAKVRVAKTDTAVERELADRRAAAQLTTPAGGGFSTVNLSSTQTAAKTGFDINQSPAMLDMLDLIREQRRRSMTGDGNAEGEAGAQGGGPSVDDAQLRRLVETVDKGLNTERFELTIKDESGNAEVTKHPKKGRAKVHLQPSGSL